jgi:hypothetical protein
MKWLFIGAVAAMSGAYLFDSPLYFAAAVGCIGAMAMNGFIWCLNKLEE